jgi:hypothetical protein
MVHSYVKLDTPVFDKRVYASALSKEEKAKHSAMRSKFDCRGKVRASANSSYFSV